ncbi:MAG: hypothetical protein AAF928_06600 [Myxococcota bacterium]
MHALPERWIASSVVLFPGPSHSGAHLIEATRDRVAGHQWEVKHGSSGEETSPDARGTLCDGPWACELVVAAAPLSGALRREADDYVSREVRQVLARHRHHARLLLTRAAPSCALMDPFRRLAGLTWAALDLGATAVLWPDGRRAGTARDLLRFAPNALGPADVHRFVGVDRCAEEPRGRVWFHTRGYAQFGLPEVACALPGPIGDAEQDAVRALFTALAPYFLELGSALENGHTIEVGGCLWRVDNQVPVFLPIGPNGVQTYELVEALPT